MLLVICYCDYCLFGVIINFGVCFCWVVAGGNGSLCFCLLGGDWFWPIGRCLICFWFGVGDFGVALILLAVCGC